MILKYLVIVIILPMMLISAFAETLPTDGGVLDVNLTYDEINTTTINIEFFNSQTHEIQENVDYTIEITKDSRQVFQLNSHTSTGIVDVPIDFNLGGGIYSLTIKVQEISFQPIPIEMVSFHISVVNAQPELILVDEIDVSLFVEVITLLQHLLDLFNQIIDMVDTNTKEIAELKQQIAELQNP